MKFKHVILFVIVVFLTARVDPIQADAADAKTSTDNVVRGNGSSDSSHMLNNIESFHERDFIQIHHSDRVPNFARNYTVISTKSGKWSDPSIWSSGKVPGQRASVVIDAKHNVVYDLAADTPLTAVGVSGQLTFATDKHTRLAVTHFLVYPSGALIIGSLVEPIANGITATVIINDRAINTHSRGENNYDPAQYGNGLLVWGELTIFGTDKGLPYSRLQRSVAKDSDVLRLSVPQYWITGDTILLPDSRQPSPNSSKYSQDEAQLTQKNEAFKAAEQLEIRSIKRVSKNALLLAQPVSFSHLGVSSKDSRVDSTQLLPHVANVSRNVTIRSANALGVRGHTVAFHKSQINIQNARFQDLGRTTIATIDDTRFDDDGGVVHVGENQAARYPIHMHHANDALRISGDTPTFLVKRNVIAGAKRWSMSVHGSHFGLIEGNIAYDVDGAGFVTEDGSETGNQFIGNFVAGVHGSGLTIDARERGQGVGHEGSGFWFGSDNNEVVGNVVAGVRASGYALFRTENSVSIPPFPMIDSQSPFRAPRVFRFLNNEAYSAASEGVRIWSTKECALCSSKVALMQDTRIWKSANGVMFDYHSDYYVFEGLTIVGENKNGSVGVFANHAKSAEVRRADIINMDTGVEAGGLRNKSFKISDSLLIAPTGVKILTQTSWGRAKGLVLDNVKFEHTDDDSKQNFIEFGSSNYGGRTEKILIKRPVYIYNYQQKQGNDYQIFKFQQAPDFPLPINAGKNLGCPVAGLTNIECFKLHKISYGGEIATCATILKGIVGFACPIKIKR